MAKGKFFGVVKSPTLTPEKAALAKWFRREATAAEQLAWEMLRDRRCLGLKFRRQQVIRGFIVDFYCPKHRLAIELDGPIHEQQTAEDRHRDQVLAEEGIHVLRIRNQDLDQDHLHALLSQATAS